MEPTDSQEVESFDGIKTTAVADTTRSGPQLGYSNRIYNITIEPLDRGYIVHVSCRAFAFSTKEELIAKLTLYINDPSTTIKKWEDGTLF